jgi:hypothetical protein
MEAGGAVGSRRGRGFSEPATLRGPPEDLATIVSRGFVRPYARQSRNLAKAGAVFERLVSSPFHGLLNVAGGHRFNRSRLESGLAPESATLRRLDGNAVCQGANLVYLFQNTGSYSVALRGTGLPACRRAEGALRAHDRRTQRVPRPVPLNGRTMRRRNSEQEYLVYRHRLKGNRQCGPSAQFHFPGLVHHR